ncbi:MAG: hypothetical protein HY859_15985, partial [Caulobacterales bacterium]|nr:hypothetical protein [Caulobacterales bacterium]
LLRAHELAPQVAPVTLAAARALMRRGRFDTAITLLAPLANSPHGGGLAAAATRLIAQAKKGQADVADSTPVDEAPDDR